MARFAGFVVCVLDAIDYSGTTISTGLRRKGDHGKATAVCLLEFAATYRARHNCGDSYDTVAVACCVVAVLRCKQHGRMPLHATLTSIQTNPPSPRRSAADRFKYAPETKANALSFQTVRFTVGF